MTVVNTSNNPVPVTGSVGVTGGVTVNNPPSSPVPVVILSDPPEPTVTCLIATGSTASSTPFTFHNGGGGLNFNCPVGVQGINVQRVIFNPSTSVNLGSYSIILGLSPNPLAATFDNTATVLAVADFQVH